MQADYRRRVHAAFMRVLDEPKNGQHVLVEQICAEDDAIAADLRQLFASVERSREFLEAPALSVNQVRPGGMPDAIGNYLVVGVLGIGGMATVYEAVQDAPKRRVALKVLNQSMVDTAMYQRFRFETETLAKLQHPGIAQIYESGAAQLGQASPSPFFAMELIPDAEPITEYAEHNGLTVHEIVLIFLEVCDAVHHGHQHGVIHRDIKPGNVLVGSDGRPRVIDFGVARATEPSSESITRSADTRQLIGTLNYMSPEQCRANGDIDIRTDVYSLGVLLYRLVSGELPHDLEGIPIPAALHRIMNDSPGRVHFIDRRAHRGLEAIILRAMAKDPGRRYDSASAMALDVRRLLGNQAIEAKPPGVFDQCRLFARRNRAFVAAAMSLGAGAVLLSIVSTMFAWRLSEEIGLRRSAEIQTLSERDLARWQAYIAQIAGALSAMQTGEYLQMRSRLQAAADYSHEWEWGFLSRLSARSLRTVEAHDDMIMSMAMSPDGSTFVTCGNDGVVRLWSSNGQKPIAMYQTQSRSRISAVSFTSSGDRVVIGDAAGEVTALSADTLSLVDSVGNLPSEIRSVICMPGSVVAAADASGNAKFMSGNRQGIWFRDFEWGGNVQGLERSPDGMYIACFNDRGDIWICDTETLGVVCLVGFPDESSGFAVNQVRFSTDGRLIAAAGASGFLVVWEVESGQVVRRIPVARGVNTVRSIAFSHDSTLVAAGLVHRGIVICSLQSGDVVAEIGGHTDAVAGVQFLPDDTTLLSCSWDRTVRSWARGEFEEPPGTRMLSGHNGHIRATAFSPDGTMLASASIDGRITLWDPDLALPIADLTVEDTPVYAIDFSADGRRLAAAYADHTVRIWDLLSAQVVAVLHGHEQWVASVAFDPSGNRVIAGSQDGTARVWDLESGRQQLLLSGHTARVNAVDFSPDGKRIVTASRDQSVVLWDAETGAEYSRHTDHRSDVFAALFSADGKRLYTGSRDQSVRVRDVLSGETLQVIDGHGQYVTCLAQNKAGTRLAAGSWFGEIVLIDVETSDIIASFQAHESAIRGISFSPDGRWVATGSYDSTVRLLDSATREEAAENRRIAESRFADAIRILEASCSLGSLPQEPHELSAQLSRAGYDPIAHPWIRKALLRICAPPSVPAVGIQTELSVTDESRGRG